MQSVSFSYRLGCKTASVLSTTLKVPSCKLSCTLIQQITWLLTYKDESYIIYNSCSIVVKIILDQQRVTQQHLHVRQESKPVLCNRSVFSLQLLFKEHKRCDDTTSQHKCGLWSIYYVFCHFISRPRLKKMKWKHCVFMSEFFFCIVKVGLCWESYEP